ncbi:MAG: hypothetical protein HY342_08525 [Candidatus Lambdaproteobacteria bacterium]|nr:hypothetical protein [Candidatus Lambdaproteobacteria bacterium]
MTDAEILRAVRAALQAGFQACFERGAREFRRRPTPLEIPGPPQGGTQPAEHGATGHAQQDGQAQVPDGGRRAAATGFPALSPRDWEQIGRQVLTLHEGYTRGGTEFAQASNPIHANLPGYQFYFLPRNFHRVFGVLKALPWARGARAALLSPWLGGAERGATLRVLDLGCGSGAFSLAVLAWLARTAGEPTRLPAVELVLVDQSRALLELAQANVQALWRQLAPGTALSVEVVASGVEQFLGNPRGGRLFAIAGAAMMLNELNLRAPRRSGKRAARFTEPFKRLLAPQGLGLLVEPGTRKGYLNLMLVREQIAGLPILYPCPHAKPCPMWSPKVDRWCHATLGIGGDFFFDEPLKRHGGLSFAMHDVNVFGLAFQQTGQSAAGAGGQQGSPRPGGPPAAVGRAQPPFEQRFGERVVSGQIPAPKPRGGRSARPGAETGTAVADGPAPRSVLLCTQGGALLELPVSGELAARHPHRGQWLEGLSLDTTTARPARSGDVPRKAGRGAGRQREDDVHAKRGHPAAESTPSGAPGRNVTDRVPAPRGAAAGPGRRKRPAPPGRESAAGPRGKGHPAGRAKAARRAKGGG